MTFRFIMMAVTLYVLDNGSGDLLIGSDNDLWITNELN